MVERKVHSRARSPEPAEALWARVRDFCAPWHPGVTNMRAERDATGALLRAFEVKGETATYRERLTYFSDSDRTMAYSHVAGIEGCDAYDARLSVQPDDAGGSIVSMSATMSAAPGRVEAMADGTQLVFDAGLAALVSAAGSPLPAPGVADCPIADVHDLMIDDLPQLGVSVAGVDADAPASGNTSRTLCLFLHGIGGNRGNWRQQVATIGSMMPAAALDLRGYGDSTLGPKHSGVDDYCADILRVAEVLGADKLILVGLSYGAWIATSFAMRHPDMLAGLVLSGGCTGMSEAGPEERDAFRISREVPMDEGQSPADFAPGVVKVIAGPNVSEETRAELMASMQAIPRETYRDALRCFTNPLERFDFSRLTMPVMLMTGEHDKLAPPHEIKTVADRIWSFARPANVRFEMLTGAGHVCNLEAPDAYTGALREFAARITA